MNGGEIVPVYQKLYSVDAKDFNSENAEVLAGVDVVRKHTQSPGIWAVDRGGDRKKLLEPLLERSALRDPLHRQAIRREPAQPEIEPGRVGRQVSAPL